MGASGLKTKEKEAKREGKKAAGITGPFIGRYLHMELSLSEV
jgi:hypothetical protein